MMAAVETQNQPLFRGRTPTTWNRRTTVNRAVMGFLRSSVSRTVGIQDNRKIDAFSGRGYQLNYNPAQVPDWDHHKITVYFRDFTKTQTVDVTARKQILLDEDRPDVRFTDVIGAKNAKEELQGFLNFIRAPKHSGGKKVSETPRGILLYGPPGSGKTMLARAFAGEADCAFFPVTATEFENKFVGETEANIRRLFQKARQYAPSVIFIDEIDAIGKQRTGSESNAHTEEALNQLLTEMDGFYQNPEKPVFVMAATNYEIKPGQKTRRALDQALVRRFDNQIYVDLPDQEERKQYLVRCRNEPDLTGLSDAALDNIAERSVGCSIAFLQQVLKYTVRSAVREKQLANDATLMEAFETISYGEKHTYGQAYYQQVAHHEAGHAYVNWLSGETPSYITIESRGDFGGYMQHASQEDHPNYTREELLWKIRVSLGGRAAEEEFFGEKAAVNTGASSDLENATNMALAMLSQYGMGNSLAVLSRQELLQGSMAEKYMKQVSDLLEEQMQITRDLVHKGREIIDRLAAEVLKKNYLMGQDIQRILEQKE